MKHGLVRLDNVWGVSGGLRPVKYLTRQMNLLLQEYLSSGDLQEATRCVQDLEVPHFHHELVYEVRFLCVHGIEPQPRKPQEKVELPGLRSETVPASVFISSPFERRYFRSRKRIGCTVSENIFADSTRPVNLTCTLK